MRQMANRIEYHVRDLELIVEVKGKEMCGTCGSPLKITDWYLSVHSGKASLNIEACCTSCPNWPTLGYQL